MAVNAEAMFPPLSAFHLSPSAQSSEAMRFTYDGPSDTLFIDFYGESRPAASVPLEIDDRDYFYVRVDPVSSEIVGVQIEDFLAYAVKVQPSLLAALTISDIRSVDDDEVDELRQRALKVAGERRDAKQALLAEMTRLIA